MRTGAALALLAATFLFSGGATAQQQNARCFLLEQELTSYEQALSGGNPEAERLNEAIGRQQEALSRTEGHARQIGCYKTGFLFFRPQRPPECQQLKASIREMERNLAQLTARRDQIAGPSMDNDPGKQRILRLLAENRCGPQYERYATYNRTPSIFGSWFEEDAGPGDTGIGTTFGRRMLGNTPTYRTLCVRSCDGYYFPISFATVPERFETDAQQCRALCPSAVVELYVHENPGGSPDQMVSLGGRPYASIPTAFQYRKEYVKGCSCNPYTLKLEDEEEKRAEAATQPVTAPEGGQAPAQVQPGEGQAGQGQRSENTQPTGAPTPAQQQAEGGAQQETQQGAARPQLPDNGLPIQELPSSEEAAAPSQETPDGQPPESEATANAPVAPASGGPVNIYRSESYTDRFRPRFSTSSSQGANVIRIRPANREGEPRFSTSPEGGTRLPYPDPGQGR
jgi:hypothetical protein